MAQTTKVLLILYALILLIGGAIGYVKSGSLVSLIAGSVSAIGLFATLWASYKNFSWAHTATTILLALLTLLFGYRLLITGALFPPGVLFAIGLLALVLQVMSPKPEFRRDAS